MKKLDVYFQAHPKTRVFCLTLYYIAIICTLIVLYGKGDFSSPPFVYQDF